MSSPTVETFQPCAESPAAESASRSSSCRTRSGTPPRRRSSCPAGSRRRGSACARPSSLRRAPWPTRCAARSTSCRAARCRRSPSRKDQISRVSGKWTMYFSVLHGQGTSLLSRRERRADRVHARHDALEVVVDHVEDRPPDAGHDPHVDDDVRRVGELHADLRHGRADRTHAEGEDVHRPAAHAAVEQPLQRLRASRTGRPSCWSGRRLPSRASR